MATSFLRRRILGDDKRSSSREETPEKAEEVALAPVSKIVGSRFHKPESRKRRTGFIFTLGGLFGIVLAGFFANRSDLIDFPEFGELSMDSIMDVLPSSFIQDAKDLAVRSCLCIMRLAGADVALVERRA